MKQYFIEFRAEYYCQGLEWGTFTRLVTADSFEDACAKLKLLDNGGWEKGSPKDFVNQTIE